MSGRIIDLRFHGRGGQGAWTASILLARSAIAEGKHAQSFPFFGPERSGAPVEAFARISNQEIELHSKVYEPDFVVVIDPTLLSQVPDTIIAGTNASTKLIVNTRENGDVIAKRLGFKGEVWTVAATDLAKQIIGRPIANTAMLGALIRVTKLVKIDSLNTEVVNQFGERIGERNITVIKRAYDEVKKNA
ncbi:MAG: 2-oxoacid:acceptor oxidoreductase family protein [Candidatus Thorarchaeota archaeon]